MIIKGGGRSNLLFYHDNRLSGFSLVSKCCDEA